MSDLLIAVGGSGQHVALTVARLISIRALPADIECQIIDADSESALAIQTRSFNGYVDGARGTRHPLPGCESFLVPFDPRQAATAKEQSRATSGASGLDASGNTISLRSLLLGDAARDERSRQVFEALFTPLEADFELLEGFYARPMLGASAFAARDSHLVEQLRARTNSASHVYLTGSFIGGTGAGVIPSLAQTLASSKNWFGLFHLLWLQPPAVAETSVSQADMDANMRHALEYYYAYVAGRLKAALLLGPGLTPEAGSIVGPQLPREGETPSYFHLVAARALYHFRGDAVTRYNGSTLTFCHDSQAPDRILDLPWAGQISLRHRLHTARRAAKLARYYAIPSNLQVLKNTFSLFGSKSRLPAGLFSSIKSNAKAGGIEVGHLVDQLVADLDHRGRSLERTVNYFDEIFGSLGRDHAAQDDDDQQLGRLKLLWQETIEPPTTEGSIPRERWTQRLAERLVSLLLDDNRA